METTLLNILKKTLLPGILLAFVALAVLSMTGTLPYKLYAVRTGSMRPAIPTKSAVVVRENQYRVGQVVTYRKGGDIISHRLLAINADGTIDTKGDANSTMDPWHVKTSDIIGGVVAAPPMLGYWLVYLKNPMGLASLFVSLLIFWLIWDLAGASGKSKKRTLEIMENVAEIVTVPITLDPQAWKVHARTVKVIDGLSMSMQTRLETTS